MSYQVIFTDSLSHHGIKGQRWGIRRFRKKDGSLTDAGKKRYGDGEYKKQTQKQNSKNKMSTKKKVAIGASIVGSALAAFGIYKYSEFIKKSAYRTIRSKGEVEAAKYSVLGARHLINGNRAEAEKMYTFADLERLGSMGKASDTSSSFIKSFRYLKSNKII